MFFLKLNTCGKTRHMRHTRHALADVYLTTRRHLAAALNAEGADGLSNANKLETSIPAASIGGENSYAAMLHSAAP